MAFNTPSANAQPTYPAPYPVGGMKPPTLGTAKMAIKTADNAAKMALRSPRILKPIIKTISNKMGKTERAILMMSPCVSVKRGSPGCRLLLGFA